MTDFATSLRELAQLSGIRERELTAALKADAAAPTKSEQGYNVMDVIAWYSSRRPEAVTATATDPCVTWITIQIPVAPPTGYLSQGRPVTPRHIDTHIRDHKEIAGINHFLQGCMASHLLMLNGEHVDKLGHALRWLASEIQRQLPAA